MVCAAELRLALKPRSRAKIKLHCVTVNGASQWGYSVVIFIFVTVNNKVIF